MRVKSLEFDWMRYGSREWFVATPEELRAERRRRKLAEVAGLTILEPANEEEVAVLWMTMREEEKREALDAGVDAAMHRKAVFSAERTFAVYHKRGNRDRGTGIRSEEVDLLAIATVDKAERKVVAGSRSRTVDVKNSAVGLGLPTRTIHFLSMERTVNALKPGHRFVWLRGYGPLGRWISGQYPDGLWTVTPTDLPRALDVYRHAGAERTGETVKVGGREYWVLKIS